MSLSYHQQCRLEVEWYREHGKYPKRIRTRRGREYVQGDWVWNQSHPDKQEWIRNLLANYSAEQVTGLKA